MKPKFDLLGDPIPDNHGKPGANGHVPTSESINKVKRLLAAGVKQAEIAEALNITIPTLTKHYFKSGHKTIKAARKKAISDLRAKNLVRLDRAAEGGNVSAIKAMDAFLQDEMVKVLAEEARGDGDADKQAKPSTSAPRGKKEQAVEAANNALKDNPLLDPTVH